MILPRQLLDHDTFMLAVLLVAQEIARSRGLSLDASLSDTCQRIGANRTSVYGQVQRILPRLEELASARPGRPRAPQTAAASDDLASLRLTIEILEHCLEHPGAIVRTPSRTQYAPSLRRLILERLDGWQGSLETFATAVRVPLNTLRDWRQRDREGAPAEPQVTKPQATLPRDASELTRAIAELWQAWVGPTRAFLRHASSAFGISMGQVLRVLRVLALIAPRRRKRPRHRGTTEALSPGAMLVTDGKQVDVALTGSGRTTYRTWQGIVDQATACDTATVVTDEECADGIREAYDHSVRFLGGKAPNALLHDNKPCYDDASLQEHVQHRGTTMIPATAARPENKAVVEGAFGLFEQRVGTIRLDDTSQETLIDSAVAEVLRAYTAATNAVPRAELDGKSRQQALSEACPRFEQQQRDQRFLERLRADHERHRSRTPRTDAISVKLLDEVFDRLGILDKDPNGALRRYLAGYEPAAIRRAAAIVTAKRQRGTIDERYVHRYLAKVIRNQQDELDLERAAQELLDLCTIEAQLWTANEERDYQLLLDSGLNSDELLRAVAEHAAFGGIPVQAAFWTRKLLELIKAAAGRTEEIINHLKRLYEAPPQRRLDLIDRITAQELALA